MIDSFRRTVKDLHHRSLVGSPMWLRLNGDSDDPNTWHPIKTITDHFREFEAFTIVFADGTPEKVFNGADEVEFAVPRV